MLMPALFKRKTREKETLSILDTALIVTLFFPWLSFGLNQMDSQPWSFLACLSYIIFRGKFHINQDLKLLFITTLTSCLVVFLMDWNDIFLLIRSIVGYLQIFLVILCSYNLKVSKKSIYPILIIINCIWISSAAIQTYTNPFIFDFLVPVRTSESRGVTGLAPEPTYFAVYIIIISWIIFQEYSNISNKNVKKGLLLLFSINIISIIFLAKSSMGFLYLIAILFLWISLRALNNAHKIIYAAIIALITTLSSQYLEFLLPQNSRLLEVFSKLLNSPLTIIESDASINQRLSHIYYSISGFFDNYGIPSGISAFSDYATKSDGTYKSIFWSIPGDKIMSWSGQMFFELGIIGAFLNLILVSFIWSKKSDLSLNILTTGVFIIISFAAIPHGFSPLAALVGFYAADKKIKPNAGLKLHSVIAT